MTPFAKLGYVDKQAAEGSWFQRKIIDNPWLDAGMGLTTMIPLVGGAVNGTWQGLRSAYHASRGNYGKAAEAAAWGAAGFIPGAGLLRGSKLAQTALTGAKAIRGVSEAANVARGVATAARAAPGLAGMAGRAAVNVGKGALSMAPSLAANSAVSAVTDYIPNATTGAPSPIPATPQTPAQTNPYMAHVGPASNPYGRAPTPPNPNNWMKNVAAEASRLPANV